MEWLTLNRRERSNGCVLIVEDDENVLTVWARAISDFGYQIMIATDAESGVPLVSHTPHVALCDVHLPGANGLWLADQIRTISPSTAIVLVSADDCVPPTETLRPGVVAYLTKPISLTNLRDAIRTAMDWSEAHRRNSKDARG